MSAFRGCLVPCMSVVSGPPIPSIAIVRGHFSIVPVRCSYVGLEVADRRIICRVSDPAQEAVHPDEDSWNMEPSFDAIRRGELLTQVLDIRRIYTSECLRKRSYLDAEGYRTRLRLWLYPRVGRFSEQRFDRTKVLPSLLDRFLSQAHPYDRHRYGTSRRFGHRSCSDRLSCIAG